MKEKIGWIIVWGMLVVYFIASDVISYYESKIKAESGSCQCNKQ